MTIISVQNDLKRIETMTSYLKIFLTYGTLSGNLFVTKVVPLIRPTRIDFNFILEFLVIATMLMVFSLLRSKSLKLEITQGRLK